MRRTFLLMIVLLVPPAAAVGLEKWQRSRVYPRRFAEVTPGSLYRGGMPSGEQIRRLAEEKQIRCVMNLTDEKTSPEETAREAAVRDLGLRFRRVPMPGDGRADFTLLDAAADCMADQRLRPMYFHCAAGKQRSNAALGAFWMRHCGWSVERVLAELERRYDLDRTREAPLCAHLRAYEEHLRTGTRPPAPTP